MAAYGTNVKEFGMWKTRALERTVAAGRRARSRQMLTRDVLAAREIEERQTLRAAIETHKCSTRRATVLGVNIHICIYIYIYTYICVYIYI